MSVLDWIVLSGTLLTIVLYGLYKTRGTGTMDSYLRDGEARWWTIGLSVMATQASAITFLSTPGQAYTEGMGFVQFYFGVPIAVIIICITFIPIYKKLKVYTAYEFLEKRFDLKTRTLASLLFLIQRGLAAGITIFAPAIILSAVLDWPLESLILLIGVLVILYTVSGGTKAVNVTQKQQMVIILLGMITAFFVIFSQLPENVGMHEALSIAASSGKMDVLDFDFSLEKRYTVWSGIFGASFLMLSYFGTDQSQVQRYLSGKSIREMRIGLLFNGLLKVPMQFLILLVGIMVFVFYQFNETPLNFNPAGEKIVLDSEYAEEYTALDERLTSLKTEQLGLQESYADIVSGGDHRLPEVDPEQLQVQIATLGNEEKQLRDRARELIRKADADVETNDKDYVFIHFILNHMPRGLVGLLLAVILSAAMSSTASELNALSSTTTVDIYKRFLGKDKSDSHFLKASRLFTLGWGLIAILFASVANLFENLIQLVNIIGSLFYGTILGIFLVAFYLQRVKAKALFTAALISEGVVVSLYLIDLIDPKTELLPFLWLNPVGALLTVGLSYLLQQIWNKPKGELAVE